MNDDKGVDFLKFISPSKINFSFVEEDEYEIINMLQTISMYILILISNLFCRFCSFYLMFVYSFTLKFIEYSSCS
jgi:hypothetical protein